LRCTWGSRAEERGEGGVAKVLGKTGVWCGESGHFIATGLLPRYGGGGGGEGSGLAILDAESALGLQLNFGRWMYIGRVERFMQGHGWRGRLEVSSRWG
jgi:hypothetical protein